ncbi:nucleotidyltransferase family protein [Deinococcus pimensis]|uniref:nucleotidyltransferase family protein n=1 Tax=Deinococcus pimensis TaxID=309888 RepID=UPI0004B123A0|nr:nucleotidyltransferase family protein [Deinococcus pimensis]
MSEDAQQTPERPRPADLLDDQARDFYVSAMRALRGAGVEFLVGGAYAFARYTGIERHTKDFDVFVRAAQAEGALAALRAAGCETERTFPHWLGKAFRGEYFIDVIHSSSNGVGVVDDGWFERAERDTVLGEDVRLMAAEDMIWHKSYVMERERCDVADVAHLLRGRAADLDWTYLARRFEERGHGPLLLAQLTLFRFFYPHEAHHVPTDVLRALHEAALTARPPAARECRGTLVSREQYLHDLTEWHYEDARVTGGFMTPEDVAHWTAAIDHG